LSPFGGTARLPGTNPIAIGAPVADGPPFVLDMATSAGAYGSIVVAAENRAAIPDTWAFDAAGSPTTDPEAALNGVLRPFGGHKGSGLAIAIEMLAGALPGALLSYEIVDMWSDPAARMGTGHLLVAIDPAAFGERGIFQRRLLELSGRIQGSPPADGHDAVKLPGEPERQLAARATSEGVRLPAPTVAKLQHLADRLGVVAHPFRLPAGPTVH
jgi:L-2-hydroxycarboxylate dehydrogenase (NAD+)